MKTNEIEFDDGTPTVTVWMRCGERFPNSHQAATALDWCKAEVQRMNDAGGSVRLALREVAGGDIICAVAQEDWRINPERRLRAWTIDEVPLLALFRLNGKHESGVRIIGLCEKFSNIQEPALIYGVQCSNSYNNYYLCDCVTALSKPEYSTDDGQTWYRCGVWGDEP